MMIDLEETTRERVEYAINQYIIGRNADRNRYIMKRKLIDGITAERIAEEVEMSPRQIFRILYKCETKLIGKL